MRFSFVACALLVASAACADRFDDFVKTKMEEQKIPGLQFVVVYKGKAAMSRSYGLADVDAKKPVTKDTAFEIASVSKPVVATAVMMLWEQGKFKLEDPIGKYVKEMPLAWANVPIQNLLSHTSGVPEFLTGSYYLSHRKEDTPFTEITKHMTTDLKFDSGDHFSYSNTNYVLLGKLIEGITGKSYTDYLKTQIFDPLGMTATGFVGSKEHAKGYAGIGQDFVARSDSSLTWAGPGASMVSTAEDMAKFDAGLDGQKLIRTSTLAMMFQPTATRLGLMDYGMGWQAEKIGTTVVGLHAGKINGFCSMYIRLLKERVGVIVLSNSSDIDGNAITRGILSLYFPELTSQALTPMLDDDPDLTAAHLRILQNIAAGRPDMDVYTDDYKAHVTEEKLKAMGSELSRGGRIQSLQLTRKFAKGKFEAYEYLMTQGQTHLVITFFVDASGKVAGMTIVAP